MSATSFFSERAKMLRQERGLSRAEMADRVGISVSTLGNYERGENSPDIDTLRKVCICLDVSSEYLLGLSDSPQCSLPWPTTVPAGAVESVETIKNTVNTMLSAAVHSNYGLTVFGYYAEIFKQLSEIDAFASEKLADLQRDFPDFRQFGTEMNMQFDNTPILLAVALGYEEAVEFAKRLTSALREIEEKAAETSDRIRSILLHDVVDAIRGTGKIVSAGEPIPHATPEQRAAFYRGRDDARKAKETLEKMNED